MPAVTTEPKASWSTRQAGRLARHWPWLSVAGVLGAGLVTMWLDHWRKGLFLVGAASLLGAVYRAVMPARKVMLLVVRSRSLDVGILVLLGATIMILSAVIPVIRRG